MEEESKTKVHILGLNVNLLKSVCDRVNRTRPAVVVYHTELKTFLESCMKDSPDLVGVSVTYPHKSVAQFPRIFKMALNKPVLTFGEAQDPRTRKALSSSQGDYKISGVLTAHNLWMKIVNLKNDDGSEDSGDGGDKDKMKSGGSSESMLLQGGSDYDSQKVQSNMLNQLFAALDGAEGGDSGSNMNHIHSDSKSGANQVGGSFSSDEDSGGMDSSESSSSSHDGGAGIGTDSVGSVHLSMGEDGKTGSNSSGQQQGDGAGQGFGAGEGSNSTSFDQKNSEKDRNTNQRNAGSSNFNNSKSSGDTPENHSQSSQNPPSLNSKDSTNSKNSNNKSSGKTASEATSDQNQSSTATKDQTGQNRKKETPEEAEKLDREAAELLGNLLGGNEEEDSENQEETEDSTSAKPRANQDEDSPKEEEEEEDFGRVDLSDAKEVDEENKRRAKEKIAKDSTKKLGILESATQRGLETIFSAKESEEVTSFDVSLLYVFTLDMGRFKGYLTLANSQNREMSGLELANFRKDLYRSLEDSGVFGELSHPYALNPSVENYNQVISAFTEFNLNHLGSDDSIFNAAFVKREVLTPPLAESDKPDMFLVDIQVIPPQTPVNFDAYIYLPRNKRFVRYLKEGRSLSLKQAKRHIEEEDGQSQFYLPKDQKEKFYQYFIQNTLNWEFSIHKKNKAA